MQTIKDDIRRERPENEAIDPVPFFQVVQFFTGYLCRVAQKDQVYFMPSHPLNIFLKLQILLHLAASSISRPEIQFHEYN